MPATIEYEVAFKGALQGLAAVVDGAAYLCKTAVENSRKYKGIGSLSIYVKPVLDRAVKSQRNCERFFRSEALHVVDPIIRKELMDNLLHEGHDEDGNHGAFSDNSGNYNEWKDEMGYPLHKMHKTGKLAAAVDSAKLEGSISGDVLTLQYSWDARGPRHDPDWPGPFTWYFNESGDAEYDSGGTTQELPF